MTSSGSKAPGLPLSVKNAWGPPPAVFMSAGRTPCPPPGPLWMRPCAPSASHGALPCLIYLSIAERSLSARWRRGHCVCLSQREFCLFCWCVPLCVEGQVTEQGGLWELDLFFLLRTALKDRPKGPPTATNHQSPTTNRRQPPPTATNRQLPTANRQSPPTANGQSPPTMVEHLSYTQSFWENCVKEHFSLLFFLSQGPPCCGGSVGGRPVLRPPLCFLFWLRKRPLFRTVAVVG